MPVGEDEPDDLFDHIECDVKPVQEEGDGTGEDEEFASEDGYAETDDAKEEMPDTVITATMRSRHAFRAHGP
eukprot:Stramenopile-MAST_4_protein_3860